MLELEKTLHNKKNKEFFLNYSKFLVVTVTYISAFQTYWKGCHLSQCLDKIYILGEPIILYTGYMYLAIDERDMIERHYINKETGTRLGIVKNQNVLKGSTLRSLILYAVEV